MGMVTGGVLRGVAAAALFYCYDRTTDNFGRYGAG